MAYIPHAPKMAHPLYTNNLRKLGGGRKKRGKKSYKLYKEGVNTMPNGSVSPGLVSVLSAVG